MQLLVNALSSAAIIAPAAVAFTLLFSLFNFVNFAVGGFMTLGAFAAWTLNVPAGWPLPAAALASVGIVGAALLLADAVVFRPMRKASPATLLLVSVALAFILENMIRLLFGGQVYGFDLPLSRPYRFGSVRVTADQITLIAVSVGVTAVLALGLRYLPWGRAIRAVADNPDLAAARGVPVGRVRVVGAVVAGALLSLAGTMAGVDLAIEPMLGWTLTIPVIAAAILGGIGSPLGAALGAVLVGLAEELAVLAVPPTYKVGVGFVVIAAVLLLRPQGLLGRPVDRK